VHAEAQQQQDLDGPTVPHIQWPESHFSLNKEEKPC
jgi:hypothetical protein